jgi:RHS repeat-associated protein
VQYYHRDHLGTPTHTTDSTGRLVSFTRFQPYGSDSEQFGSQPLYGFTGAEREADTDLGATRLGVRWLSSIGGRWLSADPLFLQNPKKSVESPLESNLYSYALNNPVAFTDPNGTSAWVSDKSVVLAMPEDGDPGVYRVELGADATLVSRVGTLRPPTETESGLWGDGRSKGYQDLKQLAREGSGARYHGQAETDYIVRDTTLDQQEGGLVESYMSHSAGGRRDYKVLQAGDLFDVKGAGVLEADQFGNYLVGYSTTAAHGAIGEAATRAGGQYYSLRSTGSFDDEGSVEMIDKGVEDAASYRSEDNVCR